MSIDVLMFKLNQAVYITREQFEFKFLNTISSLKNSLILLWSHITSSLIAE